MFYGEYEHTLDKKGRIILPAKFRDVAKEHYVEKLFITRGLDRCLFIFTESEWRAHEQRFKSLSFTKPQARKFNRLFFSGAAEIVPDKQGRILPPKYLKDFAGIKKNIVIVGVSNRIELWDKEKWTNFYDENKDSFEQIAEDLFNNGET